MCIHRLTYPYAAYLCKCLCRYGSCTMNIMMYVTTLLWINACYFIYSNLKLSTLFAGRCIKIIKLRKFITSSSWISSLSCQTLEMHERFLRLSHQAIQWTDCHFTSILCILAIIILLGRNVRKLNLIRIIYNSPNSKFLQQAKCGIKSSAFATHPPKNLQDVASLVGSPLRTNSFPFTITQGHSKGIASTVWMASATLWPLWKASLVMGI